MNYCKVKNEDFENFIYLNGGLIYYEKCPVCNMRLYGDGSNSIEFWKNHVEDYEFNYGLERMQKAVESDTVYLPEGLKEKGEIIEWLLNYEKEE